MDDGRQIFRPEAIQRQREVRERATLLSIASRKTLVALWALLGLLLAGGVLALWIDIPDQALGTAWVIDQRDDPTPSDRAAGLHVVAVFATGESRNLRPGQILRLSAAGSKGELSGLIANVESGLFSPDAVRKRFHLSPAASAILNGPSAVVFARVAVPPGAPVAAYTGSVYRASVRTGATRAVARLLRFRQTAIAER